MVLDFSVVVEAPDVQRVLLADGQESLAFWQLVHLQHGRLMNGEARVDVVQVVDSHEHDHALGQANDEELVRVALLVDEGVGRVDGLLVTVQVREDLAVTLWWLSVATRDGGDLLVQALTLVVFETLRLLHLLELACDTLYIVDADLPIAIIEGLDAARR